MEQVMHSKLQRVRKSGAVFDRCIKIFAVLLAPRLSLSNSTSRLPLGYISATSRLHLGYISAVSSKRYCACRATPHQPETRSKLVWRASLPVH